MRYVSFFPFANQNRANPWLVVILSISLPAFLTGPKKDLSSNLFSSAVGTENVHRMKAGRMELRKKKKLPLTRTYRGSTSISVG